MKGGMLVASIVGVDMRATMDIDTTVKALPLNEKDARAIIERIGELQLEDGVNFKITSVKEIMEESVFFLSRTLLYPFAGKISLFSIVRI